MEKTHEKSLYLNLGICFSRLIGDAGFAPRINELPFDGPRHFGGRNRQRPRRGCIQKYLLWQSAVKSGEPKAQLSPSLEIWPQERGGARFTPAPRATDTSPIEIGPRPQLDLLATEQSVAKGKLGGEENLSPGGRRLHAVSQYDQAILELRQAEFEKRLRRPFE